MEKKMFYVSIGIRGRENTVIPVYCTEEELKTVATAVGKGLLADSCTVSLNEADAWDSCVEPYAVLWDCM